jgi:hypothetical protein
LDDFDLMSIFNKIRIELKKKGKSLIILIEDITSFTGMDKGILEILVDEANDDNKMCNIYSVIGITDGYFNKFPDNINERI